MEKENRKLRDAAKRKYQEAVRALVDFVKKRDKRVIQHQVRVGGDELFLCGPTGLCGRIGLTDRLAVCIQHPTG